MMFTSHHPAGRSSRKTALLILIAGLAVLTSPLPAAAADVAGQVRLEDGQPAAGATVVIFPVGAVGFTGLKKTMTDRNGQFSVAIGQGRYRLRARRGELVGAYGGMGPAPKGDLLVEVRPVTGLEVILEPGRLLRIETCDETGHPLPGVAVNAETREYLEAHTFLADQSGVAELTGLYPAVYRIEANFGGATTTTTIDLAAGGHPGVRLTFPVHAESRLFSFLLGGIVLLSIGVFVTFRLSTRRSDVKWLRTAAGWLDAGFIEKDHDGKPTVLLHSGDCDIRLRVRKVGSTPYTQLFMKPEQNTKRSLILAPRPDDEYASGGISTISVLSSVPGLHALAFAELFTHVAMRVGAADESLKTKSVRLFDSLFEYRFVAFSTDHAWTRKLLDDELRQGILELCHEQRESSLYLHFDEILVLSRIELVEDPEHLRQLIGLGRLARTKHREASEAMPGDGVSPDQTITCEACGQEILSEPQTCPECGAHHHQDCWLATEACARCDSNDEHEPAGDHS